MNSFSVANLCVVLEILVGELLFIYPYEKRKKFWVRFPLAFAICLVIAFFFPQFTLPYKINRVIQLVTFFSCTVAVYAVSFRLKFRITLSLCSAGYALEHVVYQLSTLFHNLPLGDGFSAFVAQYHRLVELGIFVIAYTLFYFTFGKRIAKWQADKNFNNALNAFSVFVVLVCILLSLYSGNSNIPIYVCLYSIICCSLAIVLQFAVLSLTRVNKEKENIRRKREADIVRYESAKDAIDFINIKCHDLKKELNSIKDGLSAERLSELKNTIEIYDSVPHTGNVIIDTIMINATLHQAQYGVNFTFSGNGEWLDFISDADLKSLFMNAVSNAADAAARVAPDKRTVSIVLEKKGDMVLVMVRNYYEGDEIAGKLPETTKKHHPEEHGFGLKSMQLVAKKYGGSLDATGTGGIFTLTVYLIDKSTQ